MSSIPQFLVAAVLACAGVGDAQTATAREAVPALLDALEQHEIVLYGEVHGCRESHAVLQAALRDPRFPASVDDVVVEFGNALHQPMVDRYVAGAEVPLAELRRAWQDTAVPLTWDAPMYAELFAAVRAANGARGEEGALRIVLGEKALDWSAVHGAAEYGAFADRSGDFHRTVEREVLARGRRALVVIGGMHVLRRDARNAFREELPRHPGIGQLLAQGHPEKSFAIWPVPAAHELGELVAAWPVPALVPLAGTELGARSFGAVAPRGVQVQREVAGKLEWVALASDDWPTMEQMTDALLWLGPTPAIEPPDPAVLRDEAYVSELRRRCTIVDAFYGFDAMSRGLDEALAAARR